MENELPEEGVRPPAYREAGCSQQCLGLFVRAGGTRRPGVFGRGQEPPGEGRTQPEAGENQRPGSHPQFHHLSVVWLVGNDLAHRNFSFPICKWG